MYRDVSEHVVYLLMAGVPLTALMVRLLESWPFMRKLVWVVILWYLFYWHCGTLLTYCGTKVLAIETFNDLVITNAFVRISFATHAFMLVVVSKTPAQQLMSGSYVWISFIGYFAAMLTLSNNYYFESFILLEVFALCLLVSHFLLDEDEYEADSHRAGCLVLAQFFFKTYCLGVLITPSEVFSTLGWVDVWSELDSLIPFFAGFEIHFFLIMTLFIILMDHRAFKDPHVMMFFYLLLRLLTYAIFVWFTGII